MNPVRPELATPCFTLNTCFSPFDQKYLDKICGKYCVLTFAVTSKLAKLNTENPVSSCHGFCNKGMKWPRYVLVDEGWGVMQATKMMSACASDNMQYVH